MAQALALRFVLPLSNPAEVLRGALVIGCALTLILAGPAIPSIL